MLSIGQAKAGYYISLAQDDYYLNGGEPKGVWAGKGAKVFNLDDEVKAEDFLKLANGFAPDGKHLVQNAGKENHRAGWDLTFSAPKSVSTLWSQADKEIRVEIEQAQFEAVKKSLSYLEEKAGLTRRGKYGYEQEKCKLIFATFEHGTSREQDPQLHTHAIALNVGIREDKTTGTLESIGFYDYKMSAGALYRAELARELQIRLGVEIEKTKVAFEVKGVSKDLIDEFSKRREVIEKLMEANHAFSAEEANFFTLSSRQKKEHLARELLFEKWQEVGKSYGFETDKVLGKNFTERHFQSLTDSFSKATLEERAEFLQKEAVKNAIEKITKSKAYFTEDDLTRHTADEGVGFLDSKDVQKGVANYLKNEAVLLGRQKDNQLYFTTKEIDALEKKDAIAS